MIVTCPRCFTTYNAPDRALPPTGRKVRCSSCRFEWTETPPPKETIAEFAPEPPPSVKQVAPDPLPRHIPPPRPAPPKPPKEKSKLPATLGWVALALVSVLVLAVVFRGMIGRQSQMMANLYEDMGLPIDGLYEWFTFAVDAPVKSEADGKTVLALSGKITNVSHRTRSLPSVKLIWLTPDGHVGVSAIVTANPTTLDHGKSATFSGELVGIDARAGGEVKVTFDDGKTTEQPKHSEATPSSPVADPPAHHEAERHHTP